MNPKEAAGLTMHEAAEMIRGKRLSPVEVARACLERIAQHDGRLRAFIMVTEESALAQAREAEQAVMRGDPLGPLHGVPLALKDTFAMRGVRTTCGSKLLENNIPDFDGAVVDRLRKAGAVFLGTLNMHEFAFGATTANPHYGIGRNPWDEGKIPGGSSGGSGAAVAASMCLGSVGTDAGGSVRLPSSLCGIVGLKPTYGRISNFGTLPLSLTMDHSGPMTRSVADAALLLQVLAGHDPRDPASSPLKVPSYSKALTKRIKGIKIGLPKEYFAESIDPEVRVAVMAAIESLEALGAIAQEVSVPHCRYAPAAFVPLVLSEASAVHARYLRTRAREYGSEVRNLLYTGLMMPARRYVQAQRVRALVVRDLAAALQHVDSLVMPTVTIPAPGVGQQSVNLDGRNVNVAAALARFTLPFNLAGLPAISVPCGFTASGLPIGLQIAGAPFAESTILQVAHAYETHNRWKERNPFQQSAEVH
jgi:aspartyl-tRNA(Asn)/glutamyl-tRNA(Gln) amidotransferase subunit A